MDQPFGFRDNVAALGAFHITCNRSHCPGEANESTLTLWHKSPLVGRSIAVNHFKALSAGSVTWPAVKSP